MTLPNDTQLQRMSDAELDRLWARKPRYCQTAGEMDWIRFAKERRSRNRKKQQRRSGMEMRLL